MRGFFRVGALLLAWSSLVSPVGAAPLSNTSAALADMVAQAKDQKLEVAERVQSIEQLGRWAAPEVRDPLIELLKDPAPEIRVAAAKGLGWPGNSGAIAPLSQIVQNQAEESAVREAATGSLVKLGDTSVRQLVLEASRDSNPRIREEALRGLVGGQLESPADRLALATRAAEDPDLTLPFRADAIRVLTATKDPAAVATLVKILQTGPRAKIVPPPPNATQSQILASRYQQIGDVRAWAAQGLGELGDRSVFPQLVKATEDTDDFFLRYVAAGSLVKWRERQALPAFLKLLTDPASEVRTMGVVGVGTVGDASNAEALVARLNDDTITVRVSAAEALGVVGGAAACPKLKTAYGQEVHPQVRQALEKALARLKCSLG